MPDGHALNPFMTPDQPTLHWVFEAIESDLDLPVQRRRNILSSLRTLCKLMRQDLHLLPAHPGYYRHFLKHIHPKFCGLTKKRISNIMSDVLFAMRHTGCIGNGHSYMAPLAAEWQALSDQAIGFGRIRFYLSRLMHFCSAQGIPPEAVDDAVANRFLEALIDESFVKNPIKTHRDICKLWNRAVKEVPGWPITELTVPRYKKTYTTPLDAFPKSFRDEVDSYFDQCSGKDILDDLGPTKPMKPKTIQSRRYRLRQIVSGLLYQGWKIEDITALSQIVQVDAAKSSLRYYLGRSKNKKTSQIHSLAALIKTIAKHWVGVDAAHLKALGDLCKKVEPGTKGMTPKNRGRLRQFNDPKNVRLLLDFPAQRVEEILHHDRGLRRDAVEVQIALVVEILLMAPMRASNLVNLNIDRHIQQTRAGTNGVVHIVIPAEEVKNNEAIEFALPPETALLLDLYIRDYHPCLTDGPCSWLFPGKGNKPKSRELLGDQVSKHVFKATGLHVNLHLFRHIAAKLYLDQNPGGYEVCRRILGHRSMDTTTRFYAGMETAAAGRHFDEQILKLRRSLRKASGEDR